jgi:hypothetical protein
VARFGFLVLLISCLPAGAASDLDALRSTLASMRGPKTEGFILRGSGPRLTVAKHQLRDWVEGRLTGITRIADIGAVEREANAALGKAGLFCGRNDPTKEECPDWWLMGYLEPIALKREGVFLVLITRVGIECGTDQSAYIYSWSDDGWGRTWQNEQNTYTDKDYRPQTLDAVLISPYSPTNDYVVLTLGSESWCSSNWHNVYYRAFRLGPDPDAAPLVSGYRWSFLNRDPPIQGSVTSKDVLVEFTPRSIDGGVLIRRAVLHYRLDRNDTVQPVKRIDPLALSPRDFVDEWLISEWRDAADWSETKGRVAARDWHRMLHKDLVAGEFSPTMHCPATPDLWQVAVDFEQHEEWPPKNVKLVYFLVRWRPPYVFSMVQVNDRPSPGCAEEDRSADQTPRTLFPNWH